MLEQAGLPACFRPEAVRHWNHSRNIASVGGEPSPWEKRHGSAVGGPAIPFGVRVNFKPSPISKAYRSKFQPDMQTGVFLGYTLLPGGVWKGDFRVAALDDFAGLSLHASATGSECKVHVQRVPEVRLNTDEPLFYPLKAKYNLLNHTLEGIEQHLGIEEAKCDLPPLVLDSVGSADAVQPNAMDDDPCVGSADANGEASIAGGPDLAARKDLRVPAALPPPLPAVLRDATGHALGPDGYRLRKGSDRPLGFHPNAWNMMGASGRAKHLAGLRAAEEARLKAASNGPGGGDVSSASGAADVATIGKDKGNDASSASGAAGIAAKSMKREAYAKSGGTGGSGTLPPTSPTTPTWSSIIDLGVCSMVQSNTCGEADMAMPAIRREPWDATCAPAMAVLGPNPTNVHRSKLPDHLLPANACVARAVGKQEMLSDPAAIIALESEWNSLRKQGGKGVWDETLVRESVSYTHLTLPTIYSV